MKRKAILIESSKVKDHHDLPGARVDVANWRNFLKSDLGGAWEDAEIVILSHPTSTDVHNELSTDGYDYTFVAYSGHGHDGAVFLNDHWVNQGGYATSNLRPKTKKGTLIIDSCRGVQPDNFSKTACLHAGHAVAREAFYGRSVTFASANELNERIILNRAGVAPTSRQKWEKSLGSSLQGIVEMLACSKGQAADEDPTAGGYYTSLLLQSADFWTMNRSAVDIHTTKDAHDYAASKLPPQQTPQYGPSWITFPFAVRA